MLDDMAHVGADGVPQPAGLAELVRRRPLDQGCHVAELIFMVGTQRRRHRRLIVDQCHGSSRCFARVARTSRAPAVVPGMPGVTAALRARRRSAATTRR